MQLTNQTSYSPNISEKKTERVISEFAKKIKASGEVPLFKKYSNRKVYYGGYYWNFKDIALLIQKGIYPEFVLYERNMDCTKEMLKKVAEDAGFMDATSIDHLLAFIISQGTAKVVVQLKKTLAKTTL